jgi:hypothetical protein
MAPDGEIQALARLVRTRVKRLYRDLEELRRLAGRLDDLLDTSNQEDTRDQRSEAVHAR